MAHRRAKLTPFGRWLIVHCVEDLGWPVAHAAAMSGVSRATAHKWLRRHRESGLEGDRSSAPHRRPRALSEQQVRAICRARVRAKVGPTSSARSSATRARPSTGCCGEGVFTGWTCSIDRRGHRSDATSANAPASSSTWT